MKVVAIQSSIPVRGIKPFLLVDELIRSEVFLELKGS
jgi:hypothetical protein